MYFFLILVPSEFLQYHDNNAEYHGLFLVSVHGQHMQLKMVHYPHFAKTPYVPIPT